MRAFVQRASWLMLAFGLGQGAVLSLRAQIPAAEATPPATASAAITNAPPMPPMPKSPVEGFRELLAMRPREREAYLTNRPPEIRRQLLQKIREYEAMDPASREATLRATQLHWYLSRFIQTPESNGAAQLAAVPELYRQMVSNRVNQFRLLPPELQRDVLAHPTTAGYFLGRTSNAVAVAALTPPPLPKPLADLRKRQPEQRQKMYANFESFFELSAEDKEKVLSRLPPGDRPRVESMLQALERLPAERRKQGLEAINRMLNMDEPQRRELLSNAAQWKKLPPAERETWLRLLQRLPPMPPPPSLVPRLTPPIATNPPN